MKKSSIALAVVLGVMTAFAETEVELLPFVMSTGTQYADTGYVPHSRKTRAVMRVHVLERTAAHVGLFGSFAVSGKNIDHCDYKNCSVTIGPRANGNFVISPNWCGSISDGYYYPNTGTCDTNVSFKIDFHLGWGRINGAKSGFNTKTEKGYYDDGRPDAYLADTATMYIGDVNDSAGNPMSESGARVKARWYGLKIYEDEVLIHDFVPARQGDAVGFYDTIGKTFAVSKDGAFLAPEHFTLKPLAAGSTYDFGAASSYVGDKLPGPNGLIDVPKDAEVCARYEDTVALNSFAGIDLLDTTSVFAFTNGNWNSMEYSREVNWASGINCGTAMKFGLCGSGTFMNRDSLDTAERSLFTLGDSGWFKGKVIVTNAAMRIYSPYSIGGADAEVFYYAENGSGSDKRRFTLATYRRYDFALHAQRTANMVIAGTETYLDGPISFEDASNGLTFHGNGGDFYLYGPITSPCTLRKTVYMNAGARFRGADKYLGAHYIQFNEMGKAPNDTHEVGAHLHTDRNAWNASNASQMNFTIGCSMRLFCTVTNAFSPTSYFMMRYAKDGPGATKSEFDLNGFDQQVGIIDCYLNGNMNPDTQWDVGACVTSSVPAKLTIYECCRNGRGGKWKSWFVGGVMGAASIVLDSTNELCNATQLERAISFSAPGCNTRGGLYAKHGTIRLLPTCSFPNLSVLEATDEGVVEVGTSAVGDEGDGLCVVCTNRASGASAGIAIAEGVTLAADTAVVGNDRWLDAGTYGSAEAVAAAGVGKALPQLSGLGLMTVNRYGGKPGLMLIIR